MASAARASIARSAPDTARFIAAAAFAIPPVMLLGVACGLAFRGGGVAPLQWQPVALGLGACLVVLSVVGAVPALQRPALPMLAGLSALLAWSAVSFAWTVSREATFEHVLRLGMLFAVAVVGLAYAARPRAALVLAAGLAVFGAVMASAIEIKLLAGNTDAFIGSRLSWPINYANADAALVWLPLPALVALAAAQPLRPLVRGALGLFAALALAVGLTAQSRGGAIALAAALVASAAIARDRGRFALTLLASVAPVAAIAPRMVGTDPVSASVLRDRGLAALVAGVLAAALVCGLAMLDRRERFPFRGREARVATAAWALVLVLAAGAFLAATGRPDTWISARWDEFTKVNAAPQSGSDASHFGTGVSNRYDYWSVSWRTFEDDPIQGVGAGAFSVPWFRSRSIDENVTDPHSWQAGALAETGLIGLALVAVILLFPLARIKGARAGPGVWPIAVVGLGGAGVYFVTQASVDWLFRIPAVAIPGFVVLGALATGGSDQDEPALAGRVQRAMLAAPALLAVAFVTPAYLSNAAANRAEIEAATSTDDALKELDSAAQLNPFSAEPLLIRSTILQLDGDRQAALDAAKDATVRAPRNWAAWVVLAEARRAAADPAEAEAAVLRAKALNPRAPQLQDK